MSAAQAARAAGLQRHWVLACSPRAQALVRAPGAAPAPAPFSTAAGHAELCLASSRSRPLPAAAGCQARRRLCAPGVCAPAALPLPAWHQPWPQPARCLAAQATGAAGAASGSPSGETPRLVIYSKPGCHLCDGLEEKVTAMLERAQFAPSLVTGAQLELRDITSRPDWEQAYGLVIPVLAWAQGGREVKIPRPTPRISAERLARHIEQAVQAADAAAM